MSTSVAIFIDTAKSPVVATSVSEQMRDVNVDISASLALEEPKLAGDGSGTQIRSKPVGAATAAATAKVPAIEVAASEMSASLAAAVAGGKEGLLEYMAALEAQNARLDAIGTSSSGWRAPHVQLGVLWSSCFLCTSAPLLEQNLKALSLFAPIGNRADECCLL